MTISEGDRLPDATFMEFDGKAPREVAGAEVFAGKTVVLFGLPGAFTRMCSAEHLPSYIRTAGAFRAKGVDAIVCVAVNDPFVMKAWSDASGAVDAGLRLLADPSGAFVRAIGLEFDAAPAGLYGRSRRFAALIEDGVVKVLNVEPWRECTVSGGEALLERI